MRFSRVVLVSLVTLVAGWEPYALDESCPRAVLCNTGNAGLGDMLEHWVFCLRVAKMVEATLVMPEAAFFGGGGHLGNTQYKEVASLLGVNLRLNESVLWAQPVTKPYEELLDMRTRGESLPCGTILSVDIYSCAGRAIWCDSVLDSDILKSVLWVMRRNNAEEDCRQRGLAVPKEAGQVSVLFHVRKGDICLRCNNVAYHEKIVGAIERALASCHVSLRVRFESEDDLPELRSAFPSALFTHAHLVEAVCSFLTTDILITPGSSFSPMIAAFGPPWKPIVFEERRKEGGGKAHFYTEEEAVLLQEGVPTLGEAELEGLLQSALLQHCTSP